LTVGRGLSPLQRWILQEAAGRPLHIAEIKARYFGWQATDRWGRVVPLTYHGVDCGCDPQRDIFACPEDKGLANPGAVKFRRAVIGPRRYNQVHATLSRALQRLAARGLVGVSWKGVQLTEQGFLSVKR
jgi:hypothetical protein